MLQPIPTQQPLSFVIKFSACSCRWREWHILGHVVNLKKINKNLSFGIADLGLFPNAGEKFGISPGGSMGQLPTYLLFENATEVTRFPEFNFEVKPTSPITKRLLSRHFELDRHLLEYVNGK